MPVYVIGVKKLAGDLKKAASKVKVVGAASSMTLAKVVQTKARENLADTGTVWRGRSGGLSSSIQITKFGALGAIVGTNAPHAEVFEGPQAFWSSPPPIQPFLAWAMHKANVSFDEAKGMYYGWIKNNMPHMIRPRPYFKPAVVWTMAHADMTYRAMLEEIFR